MIYAQRAPLHSETMCQWKEEPERAKDLGLSPLQTLPTAGWMHQDPTVQRLQTLRSPDHLPGSESKQVTPLGYNLAS